MAAGEPRRFALYTPGQALSEAQRREAAIADEIVAALNQRRVLARLPTGRRRPSRRARRVRTRRCCGYARTTAKSSARQILLPVAEKVGLVDQLDQRVLELALDRLAAEPDLRVSVNISVATLRSPTGSIG